MGTAAPWDHEVLVLSLRLFDDRASGKFKSRSLAPCHPGSDCGTWLIAPRRVSHDTNQPSSSLPTGLLNLEHLLPARGPGSLSSGSAHRKGESSWDIYGLNLIYYSPRACGWLYTSPFQCDVRVSGLRQRFY